ncbi:MAG: AAA family ATPase [Bdellovibrionaceae bacterium]|nr:AAA family ATPase [Pseudobdellovibrionaceae bacterium]
MKQSVQVRSSEPDFEQIVRNLRIVLKLESAAGAETTIRELRQNGLGYNNLLYIATVLAELESTRDATLPVFLVEEPEAHLHPQLQSVLTKFLAEGLHGERRNVQTIVTTHSPTIASEVPFKAIVSLYRKRDGFLGSFPFFKAGLSVAEERKIKRMLDVTRASMLFARGVVFVEGVTEHVLLPVLANRLGKDLHASHISVVPVHGVNFETLGRLFGPGRIDIPVSIITDGDPTVEHVAGVPETWRTEIPAGFANDTYPPADRIANVRALEENNASLRVLVSSVTLEYDMALAAMNNGLVMCDTWRSLGRTYVLDREDVVAAGTAKDRALLVWRGICRSSTPRSKAEFAHALAETLLEKNVAGEFVIGAADFTVPAYIVEALAHAVPD